MSKQLFELMREQEIQTSNFLPTKKEVLKSSENFAKKLLESGEVNPVEIVAQSKRLKDAFTTIHDTFLANIPHEKQNAFGIEITPVNGKSMIQFQEDDVYAELEVKLKSRAELLKTALKAKETFYDSEGVEVPKVSVKYASDSLTIKY